MNEIVKSDIFFFVTGIGVIVLTVLIASLVVYLFPIIKDLRSLVSKVKEEGEAIVDDVRQTRIKIKESGSGLASFFGGMFKKSTRKKTSHTETKNTEESTDSK